MVGLEWDNVTVWFPLRRFFLAQHAAAALRERQRPYRWHLARRKSHGV